MAHTQANLVSIILSLQVMTASRLQNIPKAMILRETKFSMHQQVHLSMLTNRSLKLKQFHLDVTGIVLQSSDHTL
jgi:hypothetical protein